MLRIVRLSVLAALIFAPRVAFAQDIAVRRCVDVSIPRQATEARNGRWIELTSEQWQFLRGIYATNPETPPGLPYGDKAVLAQVDNSSGGLVFFIDGDKAMLESLISLKRAGADAILTYFAPRVARKLKDRV